MAGKESLENSSAMSLERRRFRPNVIPNSAHNSVFKPYQHLYGPDYEKVVESLFIVVWVVLKMGNCHAKSILDPTGNEAAGK